MHPSYLKSVVDGFRLFFESACTGGRIICTNRKFVWLLPGYAIALYGHRYLENGLAPAISKRYLGNSAWSQIIVGGSNVGELLGASFVFLFTNFVTTPMPWLRLDALMLLVVWYLPFWYPPSGDVRYAWIIAATFIPIVSHILVSQKYTYDTQSFGWAAGDVSLAAYIQASLTRLEAKSKNVSALGAVMAFLYSTYIILYAITSPILGFYIDNVSNANGQNIHSAMMNVAGVQITIIFTFVMTAIFVPKGAFAFNPNMLNEENLDNEIMENDDDDYDDLFQLKDNSKSDADRCESRSGHKD